MADTPGPCGCRWYHERHRVAFDRIIYCPTHAAAFEMEAEVARLRGVVKERAEASATRTQLDGVEITQVRTERDMWHAEAIIRGQRSTDLLAALEEIANDPGVHYMEVARAAIASVKEDTVRT